MNIATRNTKIYYLTQFFHSLIFTAPIWIVFYMDRGVSVAQISIIVTLGYLMQMLWELPSGALADLLGRRNILSIAFLITSISFLFFPIAYGFIPILLINLFISIGDSFRSGSEDALIYDTYKQSGNEDGVKKVFANGNSIYQVGLILSAVLGGFLYKVSPTLPMILYGSSLLLGFVVNLFYIEPSIDSEKFTLGNYIKQMAEGAKEAFKSRYSTYLSVFYIFVGGIAWASTLYFNESLMVDLGYSDEVRGYLSGFLRLLNILIIIFVLNRASLFNFKRTILFFPIAMVIAYLPGVLFRGFEAAPFIQLAMIATTARWIILSPMVNKVFSSKYRATAISFLSLMIGFVYILLTMLSAYVIPTFGMKFMFTLLGIFTVITVVPLAIKLLKAQSAQAKEQVII